MDEEITNQERVEKLKPIKKEEYVKSSRVIPILILMFLFGGALGFFIHESVVEYECRIAFETWDNKFEASIPIGDFQEKLIEIDLAKNLLPPAEEMGKGNIEELRLEALLKIDVVELIED